jgi:hypothetical protein
MGSGWGSDGMGWESGLACTYTQGTGESKLHIMTMLSVSFHIYFKA